ncbi:MAG: DNA/RNA nuclease SfsA [Halomonas sp.]|nr:DNA/RNA nuclease SfsA [Halomonas sp.]
MNYPELVPGTLLRRHKRFLADVRLNDGREVVAHCPNTGSMRAVNVPGCRVWLAPSDNPARKLAWTWELIELPQRDGRLATASVNTGRANRIVEEALRLRQVPGLEGYAELKEVKQVTLKEDDGHGYFPDAVSERARRHLEVLAALAQQGNRAVLLFCVAHEGIGDVAPAWHQDPAYAAALGEAAARGVEVLAHRCVVERHGDVPVAIRLGQALPVDLERRLVP